MDEVLTGMAVAASAAMFAFGVFVFVRSIGHFVRKRWRRGLLHLLAGAALPIASLLPCLGVVFVFGAGLEPGGKARILIETISEAVYLGAFMGAFAVLAGVAGAIRLQNGPPERRGT